MASQQSQGCATPEPLVPAAPGCSLKVCCANLVMSILGAGQLTLPFCMLQLGLGAGMTLMGLLAVSSMYSMSLLAACSQQVCASSYKELIVTLLGSHAKRFLEALILFYIWGGTVAFFIIVKQQLGILAMHIDVHTPDYILLAIVVLIFVWPLSMIRTLDRLRFTSVLGVMSSIFITVVVVVSAPWMQGGIDACAASRGTRSNIEHRTLTFFDVAVTLPLLAFAFNGSWSFPTIYHSLNGKTSKRTVTFILASIGMLCLNYFSISFFGYISYCEETKDNIIDSLVNQKGWRAELVVVARIALVSQLCLAMPLRVNVSSAVLVAPPHRPSRKQHVVLCTSMLFSSACLAMTPLQLNVAIGLTSAFCASCLMYLFPALCEIKLISASQTHASNVKRICGVALIGGLGFFVLIAGTYANLLKLVG